MVGLLLAAVITVVAFFISGTTLVWQPSIRIALAVLAIAQIGVHLVFFIPITPGPDNENNVLALAFGPDRDAADRRLALDHVQHDRNMMPISRTTQMQE